MKKALVIVISFAFLAAKAQQGINIIPQPKEIKAGIGIFKLDNKTVLVAGNKESMDAAAMLNEYLHQLTGFNLPVIESGGDENKIVFAKPKLANEIEKEGYRLEVTSNKIEISASTAAGYFYGIQSLLQLMPINENKVNTISIPGVSINDAPRFGYRGMHLDVSRHFFPVSFIKKYIDYLATYKFNTFHWHLTDDQGWRIEIKKYPLLTQVGGYRNGTIIGRYPGKGNDGIRYGGFYTQEEIKDIVGYAAKRHITIIPEIEMPGHASAAIAAYPQLSCFPQEATKKAKGTAWAGDSKGKQVQQAWGIFEDVFVPTDYTFNFLENVLDEVMQLFPSTYIHIGGDECPKESWKRSKFCQQLIKEKKLKDEHELQSYFIQRIEKYLNKKGRKIIGWDEILEGGLAPNAAVMSWRGEAGGIEAAKQQHYVIMTPGNPLYFDHSQSKNEDSVTIGGYNPIEKVYAYYPVPKELNNADSSYVMGAQANVWTEYMKNTDKVEYMVFPRIAALSEVLWTNKGTKNYAAFQQKLPALFQRLDQQKINYSKAVYDLKATVIPDPGFNGVLWKLEATNDIPLLINLNKADSAWAYHGPVPINTGVHLANASYTVNGKTIMLSQKFSINKATGKKITLVNEPSATYPGNGAFTLVDGIHNEKGMSKTSEFLGFKGTDMDVIIDLGKEMKISTVIPHFLQHPGSWIYYPSQVKVSYIPGTATQEEIKNGSFPATVVNAATGLQKNNIKINKEITCRYVRVQAKNYGVIPNGNAGSGNKAWLFSDEIEIL